MIIVENIKTATLDDLNIGTLVYSQADKAVYVWNGDSCVKYDATPEGGINMSLYDVNQQVVAQLPTYTDEDIERGKEVLCTYIASIEHSDTYYMLLCHDLHYFTVFVRNGETQENIEDAVIDCLSYVGEVKSIEQASDGEAIEIWVVVDGVAHAMYFFDYGKGIISCQ